MMMAATMVPQRAAGSGGLAPAAGSRAARSSLSGARSSLVVRAKSAAGGAKPTTASGKSAGPRSATLANPVVDVDKVGFRLNPATNE